MARPRFLLVLGYQAGDRMAPPWPGERRESVARVGADGAWVAWRLLGSNHREVARSAEVFTDVAGCLAGIAALHDALLADSGRLSIEAIEGRWSWVYASDRRALAVASRLYQRQRECDYNCRVFLAAAPTAVVLMTPPHPRDGSASGAVVAAE